MSDRELRRSNSQPRPRPILEALLIFAIGVLLVMLVALVVILP